HGSRPKGKRMRPGPRNPPTRGPRHDGDVRHGALRCGAPVARSPIIAAAYRLPLWLHHAGIRGIERVLGIDWIVLTTRGRRTGAERSVMLDVVGHDPA